MGEFISQLTTYFQALYAEVIGQADAFRSRAMICLQAQSLELQQLKVQFTYALAKMQSLSCDHGLLLDACGEKDRIIARLENEKASEKLKRLQHDVNYTNSSA